MNAALTATDLFFDQAACGLMATDAHGMILTANASLHAWLGMAPGALVGTRLHDLLPASARLFHYTCCVPRLQNEGAAHDIQIDLLKPGGARLPVLLQLVRQRDGDREIDHWALFRAGGRHSYENALLCRSEAADDARDAQHQRDLQLRAVNTQLSAADLRKDEFLATLSHELRNPLAPMRSALDVLKIKHGNDDDARVIGAFDRQLRHLTRLVDDLMEVSRITQNRMQLRRAPVDMAALTRGAVHDMAPVMTAARHVLRLTLPDAPLTVDGDATRLAQVVINLLGNAAKYTPDGGLIDVELAGSDGHAELRVRDNGIGIPADALGTIFQLFTQLEPGRERACGGLGIGLALARGIALLHGGEILVESDGPGRGSQFTLRLPLIAGCAVVEEIATAPGQPAPLRVLVVDDNVDAAETMATMLELFGCTTLLAHTAAGALALAPDFLPEVALLDIGLPDFNGYELARRLRGLDACASTKLIAATGWGQERDRQLARDAGFDHHLTKPIDIERLRLLLQ
ncbi:response regulator [Oxalobacteraceae sp. CFBP 13730]|nr:response regulator [Oxalobacteraceae sp. CFBP 13730]